MKARFKALHLTIGLLLFFNTLAHADNIYVANWLTDEIYRFDSSGNRTLFANTASEQPIALAVGGNNTLYASIQLGEMIQRFDSHGTASVFASTGMNKPRALAVDKSGNVYVANVFGNDILKFDSQGHGSVFYNFGTYSASVGLAFDSTGNLYGAFGSKKQILKFDSNGNASVFATMPSSCYDLAFDQSDKLYASCVAGSIYRVDSQGSVTAYVTATAPVNGIAFDGSGNLYAVEDQQIEKYDPQGNNSVFATTPNYLSSIAIQIIPEPSTWAMLALGVSMCRFAGFAGGGARRGLPNSVRQ